MPTGSSIVGTWNTFVDWGDTGSPIIANPLTFNSDGSWTYRFGGGQWVQVEGMYFFNFGCFFLRDMSFPDIRVTRRG
jgi:hypothetical protein